MSSKEYSPLDRFFIRAKDIVFLGMALWGFLVWSGGFSRLPARVEATEIETQKIKDWQQNVNTQLSLVVQGLSTMKEQQGTMANQQNVMSQDIKDLLKRR